MSAINPYNSTRHYIRHTTPNSKLVYIQCSLDELQRRDTKGLYRRALLPDGDADKVYNFTGISDAFDEPLNADLIIQTNKEHESASISKLEKFILKEIGG
jgi:adenylylsulfate kinase